MRCAVGEPEGLIEAAGRRATCPEGQVGPYGPQVGEGMWMGPNGGDVAEPWQPSLRYQWGRGAPQDNPAPPEAATVALWVGEHVVWRGDVIEELHAWARWCALQVVHLWDCPDGVRRYLQTGDEALSDTVRTATSAISMKVIGHDARDNAMAAASASSSVWDRVSAARSAAALAVRAAASPTARTVARAGSRAAAWAASSKATRGTAKAAAKAARTEAGEAIRHTARSAQGNHLRRLLLQRALPERRWPLIDGDEGVLCDALLESPKG